MPNQLPANIILPEGWTGEACGESFALYRDPSNGAVTVSFDRRWWNLGWGYSTTSCNIHGCTSRGTKYSGRGWQQKLIDDAVTALVVASQ